MLCFSHLARNVIAELKIEQHFFFFAVPRHSLEEHDPHLHRTAVRSLSCKAQEEEETGEEELEANGGEEDVCVQLQ